jgi:lysophospholipase L1-like esterase
MFGIRTMRYPAATRTALFGCLLSAIAGCSSSNSGATFDKAAVAAEGGTNSTVAGNGGAATSATAVGGGSGTGGAPNRGGTGSGGTPSSGGAGTGGGATSIGGTPSSGGAGTGGTTSRGGSNVGGATSRGGSNMGGANSGGRSTGGTTSWGGTGTGGATSWGGTGTGGVTSSSGANTGGKSSGGTTSTGGVAIGGSATAGKSGRGGSAGTSGTSNAYRPCPTDGSACKIMPFGDSITDGYGVAGGYRVELFRLAHQAGKNVTFVGTGSNGPAEVDGVKFPPNHEGHSGYTIDKTPSRSGIAPLVSTVMPQFTPHVVTLMIGTNDAIDNYQMADAPTRLGALIDSIFAQLPNVLLVVAQPIPSQDDALNQRIQTYDGAIPAVVSVRASAGKHILLVDMYSVIANNANYKTQLLQDTWHPNAAGHALLGARFYEVLAGSL